MRQAKIYYKDNLAGHLIETDDGEYEFRYTSDYVAKHPNQYGLYHSKNGALLRHPKL